ncbi:hypothetical protein BKA69DRAFT_119220 [Paraphysoderma sedebokerense]|nr:hypothetical protein BKA69DRAFT_119220 [Paraphysoderma sedebokerense]
MKSSQQNDTNTEPESNTTKSTSSTEITKELSESSSNSDESSDDEFESVLPETDESKSNKTGEIKTKTLKIRPKDSEKDKKTIFVGNLPISVVQKTEYKQLKSHFKQYGEIESIRFRSIAFSEPLPRRVAFAKQSFHPSRDSLNAYIVYKSTDSVASALSSNGALLFDKHIRVDSVTSKSTNDTKRSIFVGGLPLDVKDDEVWECFEKCGDIEYVRVIRDKKTGMGKGFGYVQFKTRSSVPVALKLHETTLKECTIRVFKCKPNSATTPSPTSGSLPNSKPGSKKMKKTKGKQQNPQSTTEYAGTRIRKDDSLRKVKHTTDFKKTKGDKTSSTGSKVKKVRIRSRTQNFKKGLVKMKKKLDKKRERNYGKKVKKVERKTAGALKK